MHLKRQLKSTSYPVGNILHGLISHSQRPPLLLRNTGEKKNWRNLHSSFFLGIILEFMLFYAAALILTSKTPRLLRDKKKKEVQCAPVLDKIYPFSPPPSNTVELHCPSIWHPAAWRPNQHGKIYGWRPAQICMEHLWLLNSALISISWRGDCLLYCMETLLCESVCCTSYTLWRIPGFASF